MSKVYQMDFRTRLHDPHANRDCSDWNSLFFIDLHVVKKLPKP